MLGNKKDSMKFIALILFLLLCAGIIFLFSNSGEEDKKDYTGGLDIALQYKSELERTASSMCAQLPGVDGAQVNLTFDGGVSYVYAKNSEGSFGGTYFSSGGDPLFLKYEYPKIVGCAVVCNTKISSQTKLELTNMMSSYLGISTSKIYVGYTE